VVLRLVICGVVRVACCVVLFLSFVCVCGLFLLFNIRSSTPFAGPTSARPCSSICQPSRNGPAPAPPSVKEGGGTHTPPVSERSISLTLGLRRPSSAPPVRDRAARFPNRCFLALHTLRQMFGCSPNNQAPGCTHYSFITGNRIVAVL